MRSLPNRVWAWAALPVLLGCLVSMAGFGYLVGTAPTDFRPARPLPVRTPTMVALDAGEKLPIMARSRRASRYAPDVSCRAGGPSGRPAKITRLHPKPANHTGLWFPVATVHASSAGNYRVTCEDVLNFGVDLAAGEDSPVRGFVVGLTGDGPATAAPRLLLPPIAGCVLGLGVALVAARFTGAARAGRRRPARS